MSQEGIARRGGELFLDEGIDGFIHRAFMRGRGLGAEEVRRGPVIGICTSWSELNPCNAGLDGVAEAVRRGVLTAGGLPFVMPSMSISEPYTRPTSMLLRNLMAMEVEQQIVSSPIDAVVLLGGCDKTVPAQLMAAVSADKPAPLVTAGPRPTACLHGKPFTTDDLWPLAERRRQGRLDARSWDDLEGLINPGVGTCNVMGTAITMAAVAEVLGFALPGSALPVAGGSRRAQYGEETGRRIVTLAREGPTRCRTRTGGPRRPHMPDRRRPAVGRGPPGTGRRTARGTAAGTLPRRDQPSVGDTRPGRGRHQTSRGLAPSAPAHRSGGGLRR